MMIRSTWTLTPVGDAVLSRAYPLELSRQLHQRLGITLDEQDIPDTTMSWLNGPCNINGDFLVFTNGRSYSLILSGLHASSSKAIADLNLGEKLEVLGNLFAVSERTDVIETYEALYTRLIANEPAPPHDFRLRFLSPTAFAQNGGHLPLPLPGLLMRSWLIRWNHFSSIFLGSDDLLNYLDQALLVSQHHIQTRSFRLHRGFVHGFIGNVTLKMRRTTDPLLANIANLLFHYANFAGTGVKTRLGMGQTETHFPAQVPDSQ